MLPTIGTLTIWAVIVANLGIAILNVKQLSRYGTFRTDGRLRTYTYLGQDFPLEYPVGPLDDVATTLHETTLLQIDSKDPNAMKEWELLETLPKGYGRVRLGPDQRLFLVAMFHQFHCLRAMEIRLRDRNASYIDAEHYAHCLNYLRQTLLCDANDSLEEGDFMERNLDVDRIGDTMVCRDWEAIYAAMNENDDAFGRWGKKWN
ncbi:hypothetical protein FPV67DRAFT_1158098 [Lyophyllum atratum]|nr:hypothetical protein FPV67DRAFT_1158098 [Lyophyllum atratum]